MKPFTELRLTLLQRGYVPLPLIGKRPTVPGWESLVVDEAMVRDWEWQYPALTNTGLRTTEMPVIDVDILDAEAVQVVLGIIEPGQRLLYRTGRAPKVAIPFKCFEPFK